MDAQSLGPERRRFKRVPFDSKLKEITKIPNGKRTKKGYGKDLSLGGMRLTCSEYLTQGQLLNLNFFLPWGLGAIQCEAQVQWITKAGDEHLIGVKFLDLSSLHSQCIERYFEESKTRGKGEPFLVKILSLFKHKLPHAHH